MGHICTVAHDYSRHGTLTLFAALSYLDGKIFGQTAARHGAIRILRHVKIGLESMLSRWDLFISLV